MSKNDNEWQQITYKKKRKKHKNKGKISVNTNDWRNDIRDLNNNFNKMNRNERSARILKVISSINEMVDWLNHEIVTEDIIESITKCLNSIVENKNSINIICLGIGRLFTSKQSQLQLALILYIKQKFSTYFAINCEYYDPMTSEWDKELLVNYNIKLLLENDQGKIGVSKPTLFYMPHCGKSLYNNVIWANWGATLNKKVLLIGNSFERYAQQFQFANNFNQHSVASLRYVLDSVEETPLKFKEDTIRKHGILGALNDTSLHLFSKCKFSQSKPTEYVVFQDDSEVIVDEMVQ